MFSCLFLLASCKGKMREKSAMTHSSVAALNKNYSELKTSSKKLIDIQFF